MDHPQKATITEVGPRDGLQNESIFVPTHEKIQFINSLIESGLQRIEFGSFVSLKKIPQLKDSHEVFKGIHKPPHVALSALVPNEEGMKLALSLGVSHIAVFTAASDTFNQHNIHCSIEESIVRFKPVFQLAKEHGIYVKAYLSCAFACPYEGPIPEEKVVKLANILQDMGSDEISLADTIGVATANKVESLLSKTLKFIAKEKVSLHFHDTYGQALANILCALQMGISHFDTATAGLGGCPYAKGATGNVATEDVLYLLEGMGIKTGVSLDKIIHAGNTLCQSQQLKNESRVAKAILGLQSQNKEI